MRQIENGLQSYYNSNMANGHSEVSVSVNGERNSLVIHQTPFAKVSAVSPGSPADFSVSVLYQQYVICLKKLNCRVYKQMTC